MTFSDGRDKPKFCLRERKQKRKKVVEDTGGRHFKGIGVENSEELPGRRKGDKRKTDGFCFMLSIQKGNIYMLRVQRLAVHRHRLVS